MINRFAIGDIHGRYDALLECLEKCEFDYDNDLLIVLGDVCDGGYNTAQCVEELFEIKNLVFIMGNHDEWFLNHIKSGWADNIWLHQGGYNTIKSYGGLFKVSDYILDSSLLLKEVNVPVTHQEFFNNAKYYYELDNMLFVHAGIKEGIPLEKQRKETLLWDRDMWFYDCRTKPIKGFKKIFIGHTAQSSEVPENYHNVWNLDTGAGWKGKLTIMNIDTEEYWQSKRQEESR